MFCCLKNSLKPLWELINIFFASYIAFDLKEMRGIRRRRDWLHMTAVKLSILIANRHETSSKYFFIPSHITIPLVTSFYLNKCTCFIKKMTTNGLVNASKKKKNVWYSTRAHFKSCRFFSYMISTSSSTNIASDEHYLQHYYDDDDMKRVEKYCCKICLKILAYGQYKREKTLFCRLIKL